ncbi:MAG: WecB/TagA/CpsF family glycosyltransferase [Candidatus Shapirobacteria bacterium]|jgi:N-acetylglucosaminyldiphosphoundecaprenol N-acetyl-beta-D-mannosaminyltransferase
MTHKKAIRVSGDGKQKKTFPNDWQIMEIKIFGSGNKELLRKVEGWLEESKKEPKWIATVNPEFVMAAEKDEEFKKMLTTETSVNVPDGVGLGWARELENRFKKQEARFMNNFFKRLARAFLGVEVGVEVLRGKHREELIPGVELMEEMITMAARKGWKVFLLGGWGDRAKLSARKFKNQKSNIKISWSPGEPAESNSVVIEKINKFRPEMLFVAYGMKKQEEWIKRNRDNLKVGVAMGVGRSFDYFSGELKRAPEWVRRMGLEWLYSLYKEPKRWRRQLALVRFGWKAVWN